MHPDELYVSVDVEGMAVDILDLGACVEGEFPNFSYGGNRSLRDLSNSPTSSHEILKGFAKASYHK